MTARLAATFARCAEQGRAALVTYVMAGDPDRETARALLAALPGAGADIIEFGMPFTDTMADGPSIQAAAHRALVAGQTLAKTLDDVRAFRAGDAATPVILMGYYNPIFIFGVPRFLAEAIRAGVDGIIVVDLPPEEDDELCLPAIEAGLAFVRLATPTTDDARLPVVLRGASGFLYYVSAAGITGKAVLDLDAVAVALARIKRSTQLPVAVGFGVRTAEQVAALARSGADAVVVGSALVEALRNSLDARGLGGSATVEAVTSLVSELTAGLNGSMEKPDDEISQPSIR